MVNHNFSLVLSCNTNFVREGYCRLLRRTHDLGGVEMRWIADMPLAQGVSLTLGDNSVKWRDTYTAPSMDKFADVGSGKLQLALRCDYLEQKDNKALWDLRLVKNGTDEHIDYLDNKRMTILWQALGNEVFRNFRIDMHNCDYVELGFQINELQANIDDLEKRRTAMKKNHEIYADPGSEAPEP